jgi:hypothetical protein
MGDADFFQAVRNYLNGAGDFGTTAELEGYFEAQSGLDLHEFLADWFYGQGYPSYHLKWSVEADSLVLTLGQTQSHISVSFFEMPVPIFARLNGTDQIFVLDNTHNDQRFSFFIGNQSVDSISIDPDRWLLTRNNTIEHIITATGDPANERVDVIPNPAHDLIQIISASNVSTANVIDVSGRTSNFTLTNNKIDLSNYAPGIYTLLLKNEEGKILAIKRILLTE